MSIPRQARSPKKSRIRTRPQAATPASAADVSGSAPPELLPAKKSGRQFAFLVAVDQRRERTRTYAVMALSAEAALAHVNAEALADVSVSIVGRLSREMARRLKLKPGELRLLSA